MRNKNRLTDGFFRGNICACFLNICIIDNTLLRLSYNTEPEKKIKTLDHE